jgi:hypothetical protein
MEKKVLISNKEYHKIDFLLYEKNNVGYLDITNFLEYKEIDYENIICTLDNLMFDNICKTGHPFNTTFHNNIDFFEKNPNVVFDNFNTFYKNFPTHTKFILYDNDVESIQSSIEKNVLNWLEMSSNNYFITSRQFSFNHVNMIQLLVYLPIIYSFYLHNFYKYPMLQIPDVQNTKYDFVTYLGHTTKPEKIEYRLFFLNEIFNNDLSRVKYKDLNFVDSDVMGNKKEGHFWNLLNSLSAKIQIIFENSRPESLWVSYDFLTEKTMKCLVSSHPYILLIPSKILIVLEDYGFKFPIKCNNIEEYTKEIDYVKNNIDEWINQNKQIFYHNQTNFYKMVNSTNLPHHIFLEKILNDNI